MLFNGRIVRSVPKVLSHFIWSVPVCNSGLSSLALFRKSKDAFFCGGGSFISLSLFIFGDNVIATRMIVSFVRESFLSDFPNVVV